MTCNLPIGDFAIAFWRIEELDDSALWLEILAEAGICASSKRTPLWREADQLTRIFVRSRETARAKQKAAKQQAEKRTESRINNESIIKDPQINDPDITVVDGLTARHMTP